MSTEGKVTTDNVVVSKVDALKTVNGKNAFEMAVLHGYTGTFEDWIESITSGRLTDGHKEAIAALFFEKYGLELAVEKKARIDADNFILEALGFDEVSKTAYEDYCLSAINRMNEALGFVPPQLAEIENNPENGKRVWIDENEDGTYTLNTMKNSVVDVTDPYNIWPVTYTYDLTAYRGFKLFCRSNKDWFNPAGLSYGYALYNESGDKILLGGNVTTVDIPSTEGHSYYSAYDFVLDVPSNAGVLIISSTNRAEEIKFTLEPIINVYKKVTALDIMVPAVDDAVIEGSTNPISGNAVYEYGSEIETALVVNIKAAAQGARDYARMYVDDKIGDIDFSEVQEQIDELSFIDINNLERKTGWIQNSGVFVNSEVFANYKFVLIPVKPDEVVELEVNYLSNKETTLACLTSSELVGSSMPAYSEYEGFTGKVRVRAISTNQTVRETLTMPPDAKYLWLCTLESGNNRIPDVLTINGYDILHSARENLANKVNSTELANVEKAIADIKNDIDGVAIKRISEMSEINASLSNKTPATWNNVGTTGYHCVMLLVSGAKKLCVNKNDAAEAIVAFLADYPENIVAGGEVHFADVDTTKHKRYQVKGYTEFDIPDGTKYIFVGTEFGSVDCTPSLFEVDGYDYVIGTIDNIKDALNSVAEVKEDVDKLANIIEPNVRWCAMGDSITQGIISDKTMTSSGMSYTDVENAWVSKMAKRKNWTVTNKGIGGTGFISRGPNNGTKDSAWMVAEKVANEIEGGKGFEQFDIVTIAYGVNDWKQRKTLGEFNDAFGTPTTAYGGMRKTIETIIASNPYCKIYMITPINCISCGGTEATNWGIDKTNDDANYPDLKVYSLGDMFEAIKEVCEYYGIEMIDMTHSSIVNRKNIEVCLEDGVHPNKSTHGVMARELGAKINFS